MSIESKCDTCAFSVGAYPSMDDPLACPYCSMGHWEGYDFDPSPCDDPWVNCAEYEEEE
jgi:hypothetical protein